MASVFAIPPVSPGSPASASCDYPRPYSVTKADRDAVWQALVSRQVKDDASIQPLGVPSVPSFRANKAKILRALQGVEGLAVVPGLGTKLDGKFGGTR